MNIVKGYPIWEEFYDQLDRLNNLRNRGAHIIEPPITSEEVPHAGKLALEILEETEKAMAP